MSDLPPVVCVCVCVCVCEREIACGGEGLERMRCSLNHLFLHCPAMFVPVFFPVFSSV